MKSPSFFWNKMNWWGQEFRDRAYLKTITLGEDSPEEVTSAGGRNSRFLAGQV